MLAVCTIAVWREQPDLALAYAQQCIDFSSSMGFLEFVGIDAEGLKKQLEAGKGDGEILEWINANAKHKRTDPEIKAWSDMCDSRAPSDTESRGYFNDLHQKAAPKREDIQSWADLLDLDDFVSFGGKP